MEYRKLIKFGKSSFVISLPKPWLNKNKLVKGDLLMVDQKSNSIVVSLQELKQSVIEADTKNVDKMGPMIERFIYALYRKGVDEIRLNFKDASILKEIHIAIGKHAIGYEIIDQGRDYCVVKYIAGALEGFDQVLRRIFLQLINMAEDSLDVLKSKKYEDLKGIMLMEEANNRFTTRCRRYINKIGFNDDRLIGPLYYIIEDLENLADEFKYICNYVYDNKARKLEIDVNMLDFYGEVNEMLKSFYELFYKWDDEKVVKLRSARDNFMKRSYFTSVGPGRPFPIFFDMRFISLSAPGIARAAWLRS